MTKSSTPSQHALMQPEIWEGKMLLDQWRDSASGTMDVTDKATGQVIGRVANASTDDVREACRIAQAAFPSWAATSPEERSAIVRRAGELLETHQEEIIYWLVREAGSTKYKALFEVTKAKAHFDHPADVVLTSWRTVVSDTAEMLSYYERAPLGVVAVIGPFNFPLVLAQRSVAAAIACGNTVVLKPSGNTAVSGGIVLARLFEMAGLPKGVLTVLPGNGSVGAALVADPAVSMVAFTGSTKVGKGIGATAGGALKRTSLELGGKNPFIVLKDADLELAATAGAFGTFLHQGQICVAIGMHLVHEDIADAYAARVAELARDMKVGDPWTQEVALGPIISERQRDAIHALTQDAVAAGASLVEGGTYEGLFYRPTVLNNVTRKARIFSEEAFGPVAAIIPFRDEEEAIRIANGTGYGLAAAVFGEIEHARQVAARIEAGMVHINNQPVLEDARAPFGGVRDSGNSTRIGAAHDLEDYTTFRWMTETRQPQHYKLPNM